MKNNLFPVLLAAALGLTACAPAPEAREVNLLHVSYDISRELFAAVNEGFIAEYTGKNPEVSLVIENSHAGSSRQAKAVVDGLEADLVSMNNLADIQFLYEQSKDRPEGALVPADWGSLLPGGASPYYSTMAFVVRKGNPKGIKDWGDLTASGLNIVAPNLKTTGNGRYSYLTAWAFALKAGKTEAEAQAFLKGIISNIPVFATGGRNATSIFAEQGQGDVLLTFEAEANGVVKEFGADKFEVVVPTFGLETRMYVVTNQAVAKKKGTEDIAKAYWDFLYSTPGQEIIARSFNRPSDPAVAAKFKGLLPELELVTIDSVFGTPAQAQKVHFSDGGVFDQIVTELGKK